MKHISIALTGHRPDKLAGYDMTRPYYDRLRNHLIMILETIIDRYDIVECHSGMALGADTIWAEAIIHCKEKHGDRVMFVADIPDYNQPSRWTRQSQEVWHDLIAQATLVNTYQKNDGMSYAYVLNQRNIGMISECDILLAVYDGTPGGTANAVRYAQKKNKSIVRIDPKTI